jgi:hypothetical protein
MAESWHGFRADDNPRIGVRPARRCAISRKHRT